MVLGAKTLLLGGIAIHIAAHIALGRRQVVRHQVLVLAFGSSNLSAPAKVEKSSESPPTRAVFWFGLRFLFELRGVFSSDDVYFSGFGVLFRN